MSYLPRDYILGVPSAGHIAQNGYWHPGPLEACGRCRLARQNRCPGCGGPRTRSEIEARRQCARCEPVKPR